jgi:hypothetical protein
MNWNNTEKNELPIVKDYDDLGEIGYLAAFWDEDPNNVCDDDEPYTDEDLEMDIVYYYGNNHWKNKRWEKVWVKYWMEIPPLPFENNEV